MSADNVAKNFNVDYVKVSFDSQFSSAMFFIKVTRWQRFSLTVV
jgi:hypothetical protein